MERTATVAKKRKGLGFAYVLIGLGALVLVLAGMTLGLVQSKEAEMKVVPKLPQELGGLMMHRLVTGEEAMEQLAELHGKSLGISAGYIAYYGGGKDASIVWVGATQNEGEARQLTDAMTAKIKQGSQQYFKNLRGKEVGGNMVYSVDSSDGLMHHYFQQGGKVVWVAFPPKWDSAGLEAALKTTW